MDQVEILNGLLAESFDLKQEPPNQDVVEIRMEDIQSDDDLSEESDESEEEENKPIKEEKIETHCVYKDTILKEDDSPEDSNQIECTMGQGESTTLVKMETNSHSESDSDCEIIATWEENDTADRRDTSSHIPVPETRSQDDLMLSYHMTYYPTNIINKGDLPTTVLKDKIMEVTAENPREALPSSLLHTTNTNTNSLLVPGFKSIYTSTQVVPVNPRNQGTTKIGKNKDAEMVTVQINKKASNDATISNDTANNTMNSNIERTDREKSMLFLLLTSHQEKPREKHKNMNNCLNEKRISKKTCVNGGQRSSSNSSQNDQEIEKNQNLMDPIFMQRKQNKNSFHKSKRKRGKNVLRTQKQVFEPIGTNNSNQRDVFEKNRAVNGPQGVDVTQILGNSVLGNSPQKNETNSHPTLFHPTEVAASSSENLEVFEPIGTNNRKQRKRRTINRPQGVNVTQIPGNFVIGNSEGNSMQRNESNNHPTLFHQTEVAAQSSENQEVFEPIGINNRKQRDTFNKKITINRPQGVDVVQIPGNFVLGNITQKNESNNHPTLFHPTEVAAASSENLEVFEPIGTNNRKQKDAFNERKTINRPQGVDVVQIPGNFVLENSTQKDESNNHPMLFHRPEVAAPSSENLEVFEPIGTNNSKQKYVFEKKRTIDSLTHEVGDLTQIPQNFALENITQKNESNNFPHKEVDAKAWDNLAKVFQDAGNIKDKDKQARCEISLNNCQEQNKRKSKKRTSICHEYTSKNGQQIDQESQENPKITVPVGIHSKEKEKNFHNGSKPEEVFKATGSDISKKIDVSEKEINNKRIQRVNVTEHFVLRSGMQKNKSINHSNLLDPRKNVATPWVNLIEPFQANGSTMENGSKQVGVVLNHNRCKDKTYNMLNNKTHVTENPILNNGSSMLFSLLSNGNGKNNTNNQLEIGKENQQKMDPGAIHNTQNDVNFNNGKRKPANTQLGMFEYISLDTEQRNVPEEEAAVNTQTQLLDGTQRNQSFALENGFYHNERNNHTNLLEPNKDVDPLETLTGDLLQNTGRTVINKYDQDQTNNMLKDNRNIMQNQISSNGSSLLFALLSKGRDNSCKNQPPMCQEPQGNQRKMDPCNQRNEVVLNSSERNQVKKVVKAPVKILENICIAKAHSQHSDISEKEIITNMQTRSSVIQLNENLSSRNVVDTSREYLKRKEQPNNMLAQKLCERPESLQNEAKLPEVIRGQPVIHNRILPQLLGQNNQKTDNEKVRKIATNSEKTHRKEIHQMQTPHQSLINKSRQQMNLNINHGKEIPVWNNGKDSHKNIAAPKKTDILSPVAVGNYNRGTINRANHIQAKLVPVTTNKGLIYCVAIPKDIRLNQEKNGLNPWVEQINYRTRKRNMEQCVLVISSEDEGGDDPTENKKKRKLVRNSRGMVENVNFTGCRNNKQNNVAAKISHEVKQSKDITRENRNSDNRIGNLQQNNLSSGAQENELGKENGNSINRDNIYEDPFDCSSSDGDILEDEDLDDNLDMEFSNDDQERGVEEVPKSTNLR